MFAKHAVRQHNTRYCSSCFRLLH